jgi:hypothetical protein
MAKLPEQAAMVQVHRLSGEVLGSIQCNSAHLKAGQIQALNCIPDGKYGKYKR